jgi:hypothetical protein
MSAFRVYHNNAESIAGPSPLGGRTCPGAGVDSMF